LTRLRVGNGELNVQLPNAAPGARLRVQLLARDLIVATHPPQYLSVRNNLPGVITAVIADEGKSDLIEIDIGGPVVIARVTREATAALALRPGLSVWALVKTVSLRLLPL
jgi:molybdate transport system ATP-binding protein